MKRVSAIVLLIVSITCSWAQDAQFSQFYASPMYLNPAFAGANKRLRFNSFFRDQWASLPGKFVTFGASGDYNVSSLNSGFGLMLWNDRQGGSKLNTTSLNFLYSYNLRIHDKWVVRAGLQFGYYQRRIDYSDMVFYRQIDPVSGSRNNYSGENLYGNQKRSVFDFGSGVVVHNKVMWLGFAAHHINQPNIAFNTQLDNPLEMKYSVHGGAKIKVTQGEYTNNKREFTLTPAFIYKAQGKFDQLDLGFYINYNPIVLGAWYRGLPGIKDYKSMYPNHDAIVFLVGYHLDNFTIGYSYDFTVSQLGPATGGSHEISIGYEIDLPNKPKMQYQKYIPCPKF